MTRARMPRPHEVAAAREDPRLLRAIRERQTDAAWRTRGACQSVDPETFFPAPSEPADAALELCRVCTVQGACLAWALDVGDCHGVWGATTPRERRAMLVAWRGLPRTDDGEFDTGRLGPDRADGDGRTDHLGRELVEDGRLCRRIGAEVSALDAGVAAGIDRHHLLTLVPAAR